ncbi:hypothetical protein AGR6A_Cc60014 [Agrobacterium sp. NCPPB 925]|nr:hypothetical protein AGR6A_Cc60014 [Agrobacterium sp. NCPPB 925]
MPRRFQRSGRGLESPSQGDRSERPAETALELSIHSGPEVLGALPPSALPGISPSRGEIGRRRYRRFILKR